MKWLIFAMLLGTCGYLFFSCTYSVNIIHTQGIADDVVKDNQTADPDISPTLDIPSKAI